MVLRLFALLGLAGHLPVAGLDAFLLHSEWSVDLWWRNKNGGVSLAVANQRRRVVLNSFDQSVLKY